jgi:hypothetical protein
MNRCLSEEALLQCYTGEGAAAELAHLKSCLGCAGRYKALEADMELISQALDSPPPPIRHREAVGWFGQWQVALSAVAILMAFVVGWSMRGVSFNPLPHHAVQMAAVHQSAPAAPVQLSALDAGDGGAVYAAYVQGAFGSDSCSDANDPLQPGCL